MIEQINEDNNTNVINTALNKMDMVDVDFNNTYSALETANNPGEFKKLRESKDGNFVIFEYTIKIKGTPNSVRYQAVKQGIAKSVTGIEITDVNAKKYLENKNFVAGTKVYVRIPKKELNNTTKPEKKNQTKVKAKESVTEKKQIETTNEKPKGLKLEGSTYVYTVQKGDCEFKIKQKLSKYEPLNYLKDVSYGISGFNFASIPDHALLPGLQIVVPKKSSERIKTISDFKKAQKEALDSMESNKIYGTKIKELIKKYGKNHIANVMTAYAKSETCGTDYDDKIGKFALFRYEKHHQCASYGYHHVLYEGTGKKAFKNLNMSIGQCCDPKNSGKLFLAFCIEKAKGAQKDINKDFTKFFNMKDTKRCARFYNGVDIENYSEKLKKNYNKVKSSK